MTKPPLYYIGLLTIISINVNILIRHFTVVFHRKHGASCIFYCGSLPRVFHCFFCGPLYILCDRVSTISSFSTASCSFEIIFRTEVNNLFVLTCLMWHRTRIIPLAIRRSYKILGLNTGTDYPSPVPEFIPGCFSFFFLVGSVLLIF